MNWKELHYDSTVVDLHNHACMKQSLMFRGLGGKNERWLSKMFKRAFWPFAARSTFPSMEKGGMDVILSTSYIPEKEWLDDQSLIKWVLMFAPRTRKHVFDPSYYQATINMMDEMEGEIDRWNEGDPDRGAVLVKNVGELDGALADPDKPMVYIHSVEGAHSLQGDLTGKGAEGGNEEEIRGEVLQNLEDLSNRGVAYLTLAHFYPNRCAYPVFPYPEYGIKRGNWKHLMAGWDMTRGLTKLGEEVVEKMMDLNMLIDICHCTPVARKRIYEIAEHHGAGSCLISTHTGVFDINPDPYNLQDWELKWFADNGAVAGVIFMNYWLSPVDTGLGLKYIERTINHMIKVGGDSVPAIGTDYDGFTDPPDEMVDCSEIPRLTRYLASLRYSEDVIKKFLGGNSLRLIREGWKR
jgi:microsomal dipeptidase-like Zn-dependent dipeptidase